MQKLLLGIVFCIIVFASSVIANTTTENVYITPLPLFIGDSYTGVCEAGSDTYPAVKGFYYNWKRNGTNIKSGFYNANLFHVGYTNSASERNLTRVSSDSIPLSVRGMNKPHTKQSMMIVSLHLFGSSYYYSMYKLNNTNRSKFLYTRIDTSGVEYATQEGYTSEIVELTNGDYAFSYCFDRYGAAADYTKLAIFNSSFQNIRKRDLNDAGVEGTECYSTSMVQLSNDNLAIAYTNNSGSASPYILSVCNESGLNCIKTVHWPVTTFVEVEELSNNRLLLAQQNNSDLYIKNCNLTGQNCSSSIILSTPTHTRSDFDLVVTDKYFFVSSRTTAGSVIYRCLHNMSNCNNFTHPSASYGYFDMIVLNDGTIGYTANLQNYYGTSQNGASTLNLLKPETLSRTYIADFLSGITQPLESTRFYMGGAFISQNSENEIYSAFRRYKTPNITTNNLMSIKYWGPIHKKININVSLNTTNVFTASNYYTFDCIASGGDGTNGTLLSTASYKAKYDSNPITGTPTFFESFVAKDDNITGLCNGQEIDNQTLSFYYKWFVNNIEVKDGITYTNITGLTADNYEKFDSVILGCKANDGGLNGSWVNTTQFIINNTAPTDDLDYPGATIYPTVLYSNSTMFGRCIGTDGDNDTLQYNYRWYKNSILNKTGTTLGYYTQGQWISVDNITGLIKGDEWSIECQAFDGFDYTTFGSGLGTGDIIYVSNFIPAFNQFYITPTYPDYNEYLDCSFNVTDNDALDEINVTINWYKNETGNWLKVDAYEYTFINAQKDTLYTTAAGTGSVTEQLMNYSWWMCEAVIQDNWNSSIGNSTIVKVYPLEDLIVYAPATGIYTDDAINVEFQITDYDEGITCVAQQQGYAKDDTASATGTSGVWNVVNIASYAYDNNFTTYAVDDSSVNPAYIYRNYSLPKGTTTIVLWEVKDNAGRTNLTIPNECKTNNLLNTRISSNFATNMGAWSCYNGTEYIVLRMVASSRQIYDEHIYTNIINSTTVLSSINTTIKLQPVEDGYYSWNIKCNSVSDPTYLTSNTRWLFFDTGAPTITDVNDNSGALYPEVEDTIVVEANVFDGSRINYCNLEVRTKPAGSFIQADSDYFNTTTASLLFEYDVTSINNKTNPIISYRIMCNDSITNFVYSGVYNITVIDLTTPEILELGKGNFFDVSNTTIISSKLYNGSINITFIDQNLFQAYINATCENSGQIYYWEILDINNSVYNKVDSIDLTGLPVQKCTISYGASDDHTDDVIANYEYTKLDLGYKYVTEEGLEINIIAETDINNLDKHTTKKEKDRYTFNFNFDNEELERSFLVFTNWPVYIRQDSVYPGHIVVWNPETKVGNWIDFSDNKVAQLSKVESTIEQVSPYATRIKIRPKIPRSEIEFKNDINTFTRENINNYDELLDEYGMKKYSFKSIGGTNVVNVSYTFYIGGAVHFNTTNIFDNSTFQNITCDITTVSGYPEINETQSIAGYTGYFGNLTNGTYRFICYNDRYLDKTYMINISDNLGLSNATFASSQAQLNVVVRNIKSEYFLADANVTVLVNQSGMPGKLIFSEGNNTIMRTFFVNESNYTVSAARSGYLPKSLTSYVGYRTNVTLILDLAFVAHFFLYDERTNGPFNISAPNTVEFELICPNRKTVTQINSTNPDILIDCNYTKFNFDLFYSDIAGVDNYHRTYVLEPDEALNYSVYLIDLHTTQYIYNSLIIDDLLQTYDNVRLEVKKWIDEDFVQIFSDYPDAESKIPAWFVENDEYQFFIHSDNNPVLSLGNYVAALEGNKVLRLYQISLDPEPSGFTQEVSFVQKSANQSNTQYAILTYDDSVNLTQSVTWTLREGTSHGNIIYQTIITPTNGELDALFDLTAAGYGNTTVVGQVSINRDGAYHISEAYIQTFNDIRLEIVKYLESGFLNWFFTILISVIAIMATIRTSNFVALGVVGFVTIFTMFGWMSYGNGILRGVVGLAALVTILVFFKDKSKEP